jgi:Asp-tRNA(Asn)/Glu-tRNA(Gln) amidotransferase A subunit family amidase
MSAGDVAWLTAMEVMEEVSSGRLAPQEPVAAALERIASLNPDLNALVHVDEAASAGTGPLAGVTLTVKDTWPVAGMPWTAGSRVWRDRVAELDAIPVARARENGIAVLGKTNTPELAASVGTTNDLFGPTHNPWRAGITPGGSSGGAAASVAAGLCALAFGDDMGGSIRIPASCCGVVGLRPTPGRVPGGEPDPTRLSVRGPLARTVGDLRLAFVILAGERPSARTRRRGLRIGVATTSTLPVEEPCRHAMAGAAARLQAAGHRVEAIPWDAEPFIEAYQVIRPASVGLSPGDPEAFGAAAGRLIAEGRAITSTALMAAMRDGMLSALRVTQMSRRFDALLTPTLGRVPMPIPDVPPFLSEDWASYVQFVLPVSFAGLPAVSVPAGTHGGLPVGVQLAGRAGREWDLLDLAEALEAEPGHGFQRPPLQSSSTTRSR